MTRNLEVYNSLTLLHFWTVGCKYAQNVMVDIARGKDNDEQNLSKMILRYRSAYNQMTSDV